jgi:hypothetical protein
MLLAKNCGAKKNEDCFPCLRASDTLDKAIARAKSVSGPDYTRLAAAQ